MDEHYGTGDLVNEIKKRETTVREKSISNHKAAYESIQAGLKPPWVLLETFMSEVDLLVTYKTCGKEFFEQISSICSKFESAYVDNDLDRLVELYEELEAIKIKAAFLPS